MGVHELWKVLEPTARPVLLDSLRGKVLAIDASIWIYQFLKAMRDASGQALRAGHVIGFFRRICKLLFYEIRPVFVFDGPAPLIKKLTTERRKHRAVKRAYSAKATANKLLTLQLQRAREMQQTQESSQKSKRARVRGTISENAEYVDAPPARKFVPQDQYDLQPLDKIAPVRINDQRLLTDEELDEYAKEFTVQARTTGFIDTDSIDFNSAEFKELPIQSQYQLLNEARLKSRLRMGYSSSQLGTMFSDSMNFSKFQIERVAQRNFFTQKLMNLVGMEDDLTSKRVSSEKGKEYMLRRNNNGWTLSLGDRDTQSAEPEPGIKHESDDEFEEVDLNPPEPSQLSRPQTQEPTEESSEGEEVVLPPWFNGSVGSEKQQKMRTSAEDEIRFGKSFGSVFDKFEKRARTSLEPVVADPKHPVTSEQSLALEQPVASQLPANKAVPVEPEQVLDTKSYSQELAVPGPEIVEVVDIGSEPEKPELLESAEVEWKRKEPVEPKVIQPYSTESVLEESEPTHELQEQLEPEQLEAPLPEHFTIPAEAALTEEEKALADQEAELNEQQEEEMAHIMIEELEENERFMQTLNRNAIQSSQHISAEIDRLKNLHAQQQRDADSVSNEMISECMQLLQLFGIPYITAPGEAEAQCAELYSLNLVDGIVTDDGDCFLFGSVKVYRNMFNQSKYVEAYESQVIKQQLGLDRDKLISLAFLLGSDYTDGIAGVGPVTGVELLADFDNLEAFREWWLHVQRQPEDEQLDTSFKRKFLKRFGSKLFLPEEFPNQHVVDAYRKPNVDSDDTNFTWGSIDVEKVREYMNVVAGWDYETINKLVVPVAEESKRRELLQKGQGHQSTLDDFAKINHQFKSKRAAIATEKIAKK